MRAPSLKSPDTFVVYIPYNNSFDGMPVCLLGGDIDTQIRFEAGVVLTRIQFGGYSSDTGTSTIIVQNASEEPIIGIVRGSGPFTIDYTPVTPIPVGADSVEYGADGLMLLLNVDGSAKLSNVGGLLTFRKG
ncbi:MAG: hypothetical protein ABFD64_07780 [Armatimonadota bacterium]